MSNLSKKKAAVLFGGQSTEHEVSCMSAAAVLKNIDRDLFDVIMVGIAKEGDWIPFDGPIEALYDGSWLDCRGAVSGMSKGIDAISKCDVILPILHGLNGEDGTVQGVFELLGIPYVGSGVLASAVSMDKAYAKIILKDAGIPQCKHLVAHRSLLLGDENAYINEIESQLGYPCFVKPSNSGSSVGVFKVKCREELRPALLASQVFDRKVIVEEFIDGREIECAVLGNLEAAAATPGEIIPSKEFYDYDDKYNTGASVIQIPADIPKEKLEEVKMYALKAFKALDCAGLSRVDFFYKKSDGEIILNEINTLPGFTDISMYSKMWAAEGISFKELITRLIDLAFEAKSNNKREEKAASGGGNGE